MTKATRPAEPAAQDPTPSLLGLALSLVAGCVLFVLLWAGLNFGFGMALDGPIGAFIMETPCQRLARTTEPLHHYTLGQGRVRASSSVCHFPSTQVRVDSGQTEGLGFTGRELGYLVVGFAGYAVCFAGAFALTVVSVRAGRRLASAARKARK